MMACRIFNCNSPGSCGGNDHPLGFYSAVLDCINYAISKGAKILNNSWGGPWHDSFPKTLKDNADRLFVFAAGNSGLRISEERQIMGCATREPNLLCVAMSNDNDKRDFRSNYGEKFVNVFAPGVNILSTYLSKYKEYKFDSGTSMACPYVAGLAALMATMREELSAVEIKSIIEKNVNKK